MKPKAAILERNIARLIQHAYRPVRPDLDFRRQLKQDYLVQLGRLHAPPKASPRTRRALPWLALAAALLLVLFVDRAGEPEGRLDAQQLTSAGQVALSIDAGPWRAAEASELRDGLPLARQALEVQSAPGLGLTLLDPTGQLRLGGDSQLTLSEREAALEARLGRGHLELLREPSSAPPWSISLPSGTLRLASGALSLRVEGDHEQLTAQPGPPLEARFEGAGWVHVWPEDGELSIVAGQPTSGSAAVAGGAARRALEAPAPRAEATPSDAATARLRGRVLDPEGAPIKRFRLLLLAPTIGHIYRPAMERSFDTQDGRFQWEEAPSGPHDLCIIAEGHALLRQGPLELGSPELAEELQLQLQVGGSARGFVFDRVTKNPIAGALIISQQDVPHSFVYSESARRSVKLPGSARSAPDGSFELSHLSSGTHDLYVSAAGYGGELHRDLRVVDGRRMEDLELELGPGASISGVVIDTAGQPVQGAMLLASGMQASATNQPHFKRAFSDQEGRYELRDLPVGMLLVVLIQGESSEQPWVKPALGQAGQQARVDFIQSATSTHLSGQLRDATGRPQVHRNLAIFPREDLLDATPQQVFEATSTDARGNYSFRELSPGPHTIFRVAPDNLSIQILTQVDVSGQPEQQLDLQLGDRRIRGRVLDGRNGLPLPGASVTLWFRDENSAEFAGERRFGGSSLVDAEGRFSFEELPPDEYWVSAHSGGDLGFVLSEPQQLGDQGELPELDLQLGPGASIRLRVSGPGGEPLEQCNLQFFDHNGPTNLYDGEAFTDRAGSFEGRGLHPGDYRVLIQHAGSQPKSVEFRCDVGEFTTLEVSLDPSD